MKKLPPSQKSRTLLFVGNIALVFAAVYCTFGALISSFTIPVDMVVLMWIWLISAITVSITITLYRIKALPALIIPALLLFLWNISEILDGGMWVLNKITSTYSIWLSVTVLFPNASDLIDEPTAFIAATGVLAIILVATAISLRRSLIGTVLITAPVVFLTFIITDMQADVAYLFGLIAVYITLLASNAIAPDDYIKRGQMTVPALAVTLAFMLFVYVLSPHGSYIRNERIINLGNNFRVFASQMGRYGQYLQGSGGGVSWAGIMSGGMWQFNTNNVNIANAGFRYVTSRSLLEINADEPGTFYIRGYSMGDFNGSSWSRDPSDSHSFLVSDDVSQNSEIQSWIDVSANDEITRTLPSYMAAFYATVNPNDAPPLATMLIRRTGDATSDITYSPYYGASGILPGTISEAREAFYYIDNVHKIYENLLEQGYLPGVHYGEFHDFINARMHKNYTYVDENTAIGLRRIANEAGINPGADRVTVADAVARYIISSGRYTLTPGQVPGNVDFALYFLEELQEGYCIHFATAAVLMLRSLDIPARFTSGYVATVPRNSIGRTIELTDEHAHAWVEVYYDNIGWLYLEVTPSGGGTYVPQQRPHAPPLITEPSVEPTPTPSPTPPPDMVTPTPEGPRPENPTSPSGTNPGANEQNFFNLPYWVYNIVIFLFCIFLPVSALVIRSKIANQIRIKRFQQENTNKAALYIWRYIRRLSRSETVPPNDIEELVLKARFSQHKLTENERTKLVKYANRLAYEIYNGKGDYGRIWLKYIRALY